ncbi:hypothetical protein DRN58_00535 [Thermococci archaeon]|nr:MAG: hypothetical protein DRN58_00535 [Thermococci archaeon]
MMKEIAIIVPSLYGGGAEKVALLLSRGFKMRGNRVFLITLEKGIAYDIPPDIHLINISKIDGKDSKLIKLLLLPLQFYTLSQIIKKYRINFLLGIMERPNFLIALLNFFRIHKNIISVASVHTLLFQRIKVKRFNKFWKSLYKYLYKFIARNVNCVVAVSPFVKKELISEFEVNKDKVKFIGNPVDFEEIRIKTLEPISPEWRKAFVGKTILNLGRLIPEKGQELLIKSFAKVRQLLPDTNLVLIGDGEEKKKLQELVKNLDLENNVFFLGFQKNPYKFMKHASIFVLTSRYEGFGLALVEAMTCGLPVITVTPSASWILGCESTDHKINEELVYAEYGMYVPLNWDNIQEEYNMEKEAEKLAKAILTLLQNRSLFERYKKASAERSRQFSLTTISVEYENLFNHLPAKAGLDK